MYDEHEHRYHYFFPSILVIGSCFLYNAKQILSCCVSIIGAHTSQLTRQPNTIPFCSSCVFVVRVTCTQYHIFIPAPAPSHTHTRKLCVFCVCRHIDRKVFWVNGESCFKSIDRNAILITFCI